nr:MAG TPA: hypothetical protein [Caudoviricetes sp.]
MVGIFNLSFLAPISTALPDLISNVRTSSCEYIIYNTSLKLSCIQHSKAKEICQQT